ncbi:MAG: hypothetical protein BWZ02_01459 [Lentisphaerae bacterium ADurb.BinA184]|nr:MAG: hypothetical protein BWZ02_01459 [Lentisphaerae bacterium ADurb.BinA184]
MGRVAGNRLFRLGQPGRYREVVRAHLPLAALTGLMLVVPALVDPARIPLRTCLFRLLTGRSCPFCGLTRGFHGIAAGEFAAVARACPAAFAVYVGVALLFVWHTAGLLCRVRLERGELLRPGRALRVGGGIAAGAVILANWVYRLAAGLH